MANGFHGPTYIIAAVVGVAVLAALVVYFRRRRRGTGAHAAGREQARPSEGQPRSTPRRQAGHVAGRTAAAYPSPLG